MMELKIICQCGQKYKFDVEPVGGRMPFTVNCPVCNADGTATANARLAEHFRFVPSPQSQAAPPPVPVGFAAPPPIAVTAPPPIAPIAAPAPVAPSPVGSLRINREVQAAPAPAASTAPSDNAPPAIGAARPFEAAKAAQAEREKQASFSKGLLGGVIGALVGALVYYLIFKYSGYHIKLLAIGVGALAGWLADFLGKGEGSKELGGITAVLVLAGLVGAQYVAAIGWWHEVRDADLKEAQAEYAQSVTEAKNVVQAVPTGSDVEIRVYLTKQAAKDGEQVSPATIPDDDVKDFRDNQLPEYRGLANGTITKEQYAQKNDLKMSMSKEEQQSDDNTFKGIFLLFFLSKTNLFSLAAAAALAFKLSTNA